MYTSFNSFTQTHLISYVTSFSSNSISIHSPIRSPAHSPEPSTPSFHAMRLDMTLDLCARGHENQYWIQFLCLFDVFQIVCKPCVSVILCKCRSQVSDDQDKPFGTNVAGGYLFIREVASDAKGPSSPWCCTISEPHGPTARASANEDVEEAVWTMKTHGKDARHCRRR